MRLVHLSAAVVGGVLLAASSGAQAPEATPVKIAFVDVEKAVVVIDEGKARLKELGDWARPRQEELAKLGKEIENLKNELASRGGVASDDALGELNRKLVARQREFEDRQRVGKREYEERQNGVLRDIGIKLNEVITKYADTNRYTAVFILKPNDLVYLANSADLTDTVIKLYNERYPYPPATAPAGK